MGFLVGLVGRGVRHSLVFAPWSQVGRFSHSRNTSSWTWYSPRSTRTRISPHAPLGEERAGADESQVEFSQVLLGEERPGKVPDVPWAIHEISLNIRTWYNYTE